MCGETYGVLGGFETLSTTQFYPSPAVIMQVEFYLSRIGGWWNPPATLSETTLSLLQRARSETTGERCNEALDVCYGLDFADVARTVSIHHSTTIATEDRPRGQAFQDVPDDVTYRSTNYVDAYRQGYSDHPAKPDVLDWSAGSHLRP